MEVFAELENLYTWVDAIPLSKSTRDVTRDFSDGVLMAELCEYFFPKIVDIHNYTQTNSHSAKVVNWEMLNLKVFNKLQMRVTLDLIHQIASGTPGALESVLLVVKKKVEEQLKTEKLRGDSGDAAAFGISTVILKEIKDLKKEVQLINNTITTLSKKMEKIEILLEMKDQCLTELASDVEQLKMKKNESFDSFNSILV